MSAPVAKLVKAKHLKCFGEILVGSNPTRGTFYISEYDLVSTHTSTLELQSIIREYARKYTLNWRLYKSPVHMAYILEVWK